MENKAKNYIEEEIYKIIDKKITEENFIEKQLNKVIEEKFENIREKIETTSSNNNIKELKLELETDENGFVSYTTKKISGILESIFIIPDGKFQIEVVFNEVENVKLFTSADLEVPIYVPIRQDVFVYMNHNKATDKDMSSNAKYALNDSLKINVNGQPNKKIVLKFRYL